MKTPYLVYVIEGPHAVKVGISACDIDARLRELKRASGHAGLVVSQTWEFDDRAAAYDVEQGAHWVLRDSRTVGEWFSCTAAEARAAVESVVAGGRPIESWMGAKDAAAIRAWQAANKARS